MYSATRDRLLALLNEQQAAKRLIPKTGPVPGQPT
jgi:hypothetical protein